MLVIADSKPDRFCELLKVLHEALPKSNPSQKLNFESSDVAASESIIPIDKLSTKNIQARLAHQESNAKPIYQSLTTKRVPNLANYLPQDHQNQDPSHQSKKIKGVLMESRAKQNLKAKLPEFETAYEKLLANAQKLKKSRKEVTIETSNSTSGSSPERQGLKRRQLGSRTKFISPLLSNSASGKANESNGTIAADLSKNIYLKNIEPDMVEKVVNEIMVVSDHPVSWADICGLKHAKKTIHEIVILPMLRPDIFSGLRSPPKGLLLFGPPGTGKTLIGKCIAAQAKATFFSISSSSLTSKWIGEGEKMVRALFAVARSRQPSVIFVDEIDSLLSERNEGENEATRRIKTEFLVQFDGCGTSSEDRILLIGATNRPYEIDEAARRRFRKKLYIPLPESEARRQIIINLLSKHPHNLTEEMMQIVVNETCGYSGSDVDGLIREAALGPIR